MERDALGWLAFYWSKPFPSRQSLSPTSPAPHSRLDPAALRRSSFPGITLHGDDTVVRMRGNSPPYHGNTVKRLNGKPKGFL